MKFATCKIDNHKTNEAEEMWVNNSGKQQETSLKINQYLFNIGTRPLYLDHYLSAISLMYAQTGDEKFLERSNYIVQTLLQC